MTVDDGHDTAAGRFEWERVIRRARLGPGTATRAVALTLATYADPDGTNVRPGQVELSDACEISEKAVRNALRKLESLGLIERVYKGGRHGLNGYADVYRLAIPVDLLERVELLPVAGTPRRRPLPTGTPVPPGNRSQPELSALPTGTERLPTGTESPPNRNWGSAHHPRPTTDQTTDQGADHLEHATTDRARDDEHHHLGIDFFVAHGRHT